MFKTYDFNIVFWPICTKIIDGGAMRRIHISMFLLCLFDDLLSIIQEEKSDIFPKLDIWTRLFTLLGQPFWHKKGNWKTETYGCCHIWPPIHNSSSNSRPPNMWMGSLALFDIETNSMKTRKLVGAHFVKQLIIIPSPTCSQESDWVIDIVSRKIVARNLWQKGKENSENLQNMGVEASPVTTHS